MNSQLARDILDVLDSSKRAADVRERVLDQLVKDARQRGSTGKIRVRDVYVDVIGEAPGNTSNMNADTKANYNLISYIVGKANEKLSMGNSKK